MANIYWVSPTGVASWAAAESDTALSGTACCSLSTACANAAGGDTVKFRGGEYQDAQLKPLNSGSAGSYVTFEAYDSEVPVLTDATEPVDKIAIWITRSYIVVRGFSVRDTERHGVIRNVHHVEIDSCAFSTPNARNFLIWADVGEETYDIWVHDCTFTDMGAVTDGEDGAGPKVGTHVSGLTGDEVHNCTIENNTYSTGGGHHNLEISAPESVVRNNFFHHEGTITATGTTPEYAPMDNGKYGNRNLMLEAFHASAIRPRMLVEGNRIGPSGAPPDDAGGDGLVIVSSENIIRFNEVYGAQNNGVMFKVGEVADAGRNGDNNYFYNNTIIGSGQYDNTNGGNPISPYTGALWDGASLRYYKSTTEWPTGNLVKNSVFYGHLGTKEIETQGTTAETDNTHENNHWQANGDPLLINTTISLTDISETVPDLRPKATSPLLNGGGSLTSTNGTGLSSTTLVVDDALYFQDGSKGASLSTVAADWIAVGAVDNVAQISSIDYDTNTITLASALTWSDEDDVWLYKDSTGTQQLYGTAPDIGAYQFTGDEVPNAPTDLTLIAL